MLLYLHCLVMEINEIELYWTDLNEFIFFWWFFCLRWDQEPMFLYELINLLTTELFYIHRLLYRTHPVPVDNGVLGGETMMWRVRGKEIEEGCRPGEEEWDEKEKEEKRNEKRGGWRNWMRKKILHLTKRTSRSLEDMNYLTLQPHIAYVMITFGPWCYRQNHFHKQCVPEKKGTENYWCFIIT